MHDRKMRVRTTDKVMLTQMQEVRTDLGEPDWKLIEPVDLSEDGTVAPWLVDLTRQNTFMIHSDKILTIVEPNSKLIEKYEDLVK